MKIISKILSYRCSLIGYDARNEETIQKIVDNIPSKILFDNVFSKEKYIDYFTTKEVIREIKLLELLNESVSINVILNLNNLKNEDDDRLMSQARDIRELINFLNSKLYQLSTDGRNIKLILLSSIYSAFYNGSNKPVLAGGSSPLYSSDYCVYLENNNLTVIKDRNGSESGTQISNLIFE